jgi:hypothetical protein
MRIFKGWFQLSEWRPCLRRVLPKNRVLFFLWAERRSAKDIHKEMFSVYGGKCLSRKAVHNGVEKFCQGRSNVAYGARRSRPVEIVTESTVQRMEELIRTGRWMIV